MTSEQRGMVHASMNDLLIEQKIAADRAIEIIKRLAALHKQIAEADRVEANDIK